ncbi:MAG TPA: type II secretion system F family protein [Anaerolineae bacterium]
MTSLASSRKRTVKSYFEEVSAFEIFYQLAYMSATSAAGISRARVFQLARQLPTIPARYFKKIHEVAENMRYNYPDAVRMVGEQVPADDIKTFLLRLSDALRSGEPLAGFLTREAGVQGEHYANDYTRRLESLKKWNDAYTAITVSAALIVVINMVSTMIYSLSTGLMIGMTFVAIAASFGVAWVTFRSAPQETVCVPLAKGSHKQRRSHSLSRILLPLTLVVVVVLAALGVTTGLVFIVAGVMLLPVGWISRAADRETTHKDAEVSSFFRSLGGTATSRGTTLKEALAHMKIDSFPALQPDIRMLKLRLASFGRPPLCWELFGVETGSKLADQATGIFYEAVNLGGDPEKTGLLTSEFAMKTAMLRAQRRGISATFSWLTLAMQAVLAMLMVFLLGVLEQFAGRMAEAMSTLGEGSTDAAALGLGNMFMFSTPQLQFLQISTVFMIAALAAINAFAVVATEGSHLIKSTYYMSLLLVLSGICFLIVPPVVRLII